MLRVSVSKILKLGIEHKHFYYIKQILQNYMMYIAYIQICVITPREGNISNCHNFLTT